LKIAAFAMIALIAWIANANAQTTLHYASGLGASEAPAGAALGFNMADVGDLASLNALPPGMKGLIWLGIKAEPRPSFRTR
jgi:hypothetical protein